MNDTAGQFAAPAALPSAPDTPAAGDTARLWVRAGDQTFSLRISEVDAVRDCPPLTQVPGGQTWLVGVGGHRGRLLPVVDLAAAQGGSMPADHAVGKLLLVDLGGHRLGFSVTDVSAEEAAAPGGAAPLAIRALAARLLEDAFEPGVFPRRALP